MGETMWNPPVLAGHQLKISLMPRFCCLVTNQFVWFCERSGALSLGNYVLLVKNNQVYLALQVVTMLGQLNGSSLWSQLPRRSSGSVFHLRHPSHGDCKFPIDPPWRTLGLDYINLQTFLLCGSVSKYLCSISNPNSCRSSRAAPNTPVTPDTRGEQGQ